MTWSQSKAELWLLENEIRGVEFPKKIYFKRTGIFLAYRTQLVEAPIQQGSCHQVKMRRNVRVLQATFQTDHFIPLLQQWCSRFSLPRYWSWLRLQKGFQNKQKTKQLSKPKLTLPSPLISPLCLINPPPCSLNAHSQPLHPLECQQKSQRPPNGQSKGFFLVLIQMP